MPSVKKHCMWLYSQRRETKKQGIIFQCFQTSHITGLWLHSFYLPLANVYPVAQQSSFWIKCKRSCKGIWLNYWSAFPARTSQNVLIFFISREQMRICIDFYFPRSCKTAIPGNESLLCKHGNLPLKDRIDDSYFVKLILILNEQVM